MCALTEGLNEWIIIITIIIIIIIIVIVIIIIVITLWSSLFYLTDVKVQISF